MRSLKLPAIPAVRLSSDIIFMNTTLRLVQMTEQVQDVCTVQHTAHRTQFMLTFTKDVILIRLRPRGL
jgi:hypothetical protein